MIEKKNINCKDFYKEWSKKKNRIIGSKNKEKSLPVLEYFGSKEKLTVLDREKRTTYTVKGDFSKEENFKTEAKKIVKEKYGKEVVPDVIPGMFLFNNQKTTDNIILSVDPKTEEEKVAIIERKFPPYGWAFVGGMVDDADVASAKKSKESNAAEINREKEIEEEAGVTDIEVLGSIEVEAYEVRGSISTLLSVVKSKNGMDEAKAGDDAADLVWIGEEELDSLSEGKTLSIGQKDIELIPHHQTLAKEASSIISKSHPKNIPSLLSHTKSNEDDNDLSEKPKI